MDGHHKVKVIRVTYPQLVGDGYDLPDNWKPFAVAPAEMGCFDIFCRHWERQSKAVGPSTHEELTAEFLHSRLGD